MPEKHGLLARAQLNHQEIEEVRELANLCNSTDNVENRLAWSMIGKRKQKDSQSADDFLYYEHGLLVGYLGIFSHQPTEGEITGMVHPDYRQRGIFRSLLSAVVAECKRREMTSLLLIVEKASSRAQEIVKKLPTTLHHTEYKMVYQTTHARQSPHSERFQFRLAKTEDIPVLNAIMAEAFDIPLDHVNWYTEEALTTGTNSYFVAEEQQQVIGKADVLYDSGQAGIIGVAVDAAHRGLGCGRFLLNQTVEHTLQRGIDHIWLEVMTDNENALKLYESCGFQITQAYNYYQLQTDA